MSAINKEYLKSLIPEDLLDGKAVLEEGRKLAKDIEVKQSRFIRESKYDTYIDFMNDCIANNRIQWSTNIGLATMKEQMDGISDLYEWSQKNDVFFHSPLVIPSMNMAVPKELRPKMAKATSYMIESSEDWAAHGELEGVECLQSNQVGFVPNALENTINSLRGGNVMIGSVDQIIWNFPGCDNHAEYVADIVRVLGILSENRDKGCTASAYLDDGFSGYATDAITYVGHALFLKHVISDLCGVRFMVGFGNLVSDGRYKAALLKAISDLTKTDDQPGILLYHAATATQWDHDIESNFGSSLQEILFMILAERRYHSGANLITVPVTESVCVPTLDNIKGIMGAASRMEKNAEIWESVIDFTSIDEMAEIMKQEGKKFYQNIITTLSEAGLDTEDPLQMLMFVKNFNGSFFEDAFHPMMREQGKIVPRFPTDLGLLTMRYIDESVTELKAKGMEGSLTGTKIVLVSYDGHAYGLKYAKNVLERMGATVIDGGVDCTVCNAIDLAKESDAKFVGFSTHNGQALDLAAQINEASGDNSKAFMFFMGGVLNTILPGHSEPSDVSEMVKKKGILASNSMLETIETILKKKK